MFNTVHYSGSISENKIHLNQVVLFISGLFGVVVVVGSVLVKYGQNMIKNASDRRKEIQWPLYAF